MATVGSECRREKSLPLWRGDAGAIIVVFGRFVIAPFVPGGGLIGVGRSGGCRAHRPLVALLQPRCVVGEDRRGPACRAGPVMTQVLVHPSIGDGAAGGMLFTLLLPATVPPFLVSGALLAVSASCASGYSAAGGWLVGGDRRLESPIPTVSPTGCPVPRADRGCSAPFGACRRRPA